MKAKCIKAKCTPQQMMKVIKRNMENPDELRPEHILILAVISSAISDLLVKTYHQSAKAFFNHKLFHTYCHLLGLRPEATRELLVRGGFLGA